MPGVELAAAYISLTPSAKNIGRKISAELGPELDHAAKQAGERAGNTVAEGFRSKMSSAGQSLTKVGTAASVGLTLPILALGKATLDAASNLNESLSKARTVFGEHTGGIEALAATAAIKLGQSKASVLEAAGTFGNLFTALKIGQQPAAEMSSKLVILASDLASFNNVTPEEALEALRSGLVGETEPLRRFGVNMNDATLKAKALELGIYNGTGVLEPAAKAQAAYGLIMEQTATAQGDFTRTADGAANKQRILNAQFTDAKASMGKALLPLFTQLATTVGKLAEKFTTLSPTTQKIILAVAGVLAVAGPLGLALGGIATIIGLIASPIGLVVVGAVALAAGLFYLWQKFEALRPVMVAIGVALAVVVAPVLALAAAALYLWKNWDRLPEIFGKLIASIRAALPQIISTIAGWAQAFWAWVPGAALSLLTKLGELLLQLGTWVGTVALPAIISKLAEWAGAFAAWVPGAVIRLIGELAALAIRVGGWILFEGLPQLVLKLAEWARAFWSWVPGAIVDLIKALPGFAKALFDFISELPGKIAEAAKDIAKGLISIGGKMIDGIVEGIKASAGKVADAVYETIPGGKDGALGKAFRLAVPGLAAGGWAQGGMPHIVGERGPELFIPKSTGYVVPNHALGAATGGGGFSVGDISVMTRRDADTARDIVMRLRDEAFLAGR